MILLTVNQIKKVCKFLFGSAALFAEHTCGYIHNNAMYLSIMGTWFSVTDKDGLQPVDLSERHAILDMIITATDNGLFHEVCKSFLEEESKDLVTNLQNALKEWDL